jgi:hypothetical protein
LKTIQQLINFVRANDIHIIPPGTIQWQRMDCYTAYKNFTHPGGCVLAEDENPVVALKKLHKELTKKPSTQKGGATE